MMRTVSKGLFKQPDKIANNCFDTRATSMSFNEIRVIKRQSDDDVPEPKTPEIDCHGHTMNFTDSKKKLESKRIPKIIAFGGGKGGIGKSFLSGNISFALAKSGLNVSLIDLDIGAANLHTCLGVNSPKNSIVDFINNNVDDIETLGVPGGIDGLTLYAGGQEFWQQIKMKTSEKTRLISKLQSIDSDYVILDLGAGTHTNTLDFFVFSHGGVIVVVPEPTSIENAYVFMKSVLFRKVQSVLKAIDKEGVSEELLSNLSNPKNTEPPLAQLHNFQKKHPKLGEILLKVLKSTRIGIIMNQTRTQSDIELGFSMSQVCERFFGLTADFLGATNFDDSVWRSIRVRRPVFMDFPSSQISHSINKLAEKMYHTFR
jgi:flagellar biosynthesis protein FlhG